MSDPIPVYRPSPKPPGDDVREFPTAVVASLSSGITLCEFSAIHEFAAFLMGHPIWTHHFANEALWEAMRCDNYREHVAALETKHGPTQRIRKGNGSTAISPLDGIPEGKPIIVVKA